MSFPEDQSESEIYENVDYVAQASGNVLHITHNLWDGSKDEPICPRGPFRGKSIDVFPKGTKKLCSDCKEMYESLKSVNLEKIPRETNRITRARSTDNIYTVVPKRPIRGEDSDLGEYYCWHDNTDLFVAPHSIARSMVSEVQENKAGRGVLGADIGVPVVGSNNPRVPASVLKAIGMQKDAIVCWIKKEDPLYLQGKLRRPEECKRSSLKLSRQEFNSLKPDSISTS